MIKGNRRRCENHIETCLIEGCTHWAQKPYCSMHKNRLYKHGEAGGNDRRMRERGAGTGWYLSPKGYLVREAYDPASPNKRNRRAVFQHREVMEEALGRPLEKWENVHHINGVRTDNRPENLELWVTMQPSGQRVSDLLIWAREIEARYGKEAA